MQKILYLVPFIDRVYKWAGWLPLLCDNIFVIKNHVCVDGKLVEDVFKHDLEEDLL